MFISKGVETGKNNLSKEKEIGVGVQMERSLFADDFCTQEKKSEGIKERSLDENSAQLDNEFKKADEKKTEKVNVQGLKKILIDQDYRCALSGVVLSPDCASLDHIVPLVKGGKHVLSNVQIVHPVVNRLKGQMDQHEFMQWVNLIASHSK